MNLIEMRSKRLNMALELASSVAEDGKTDRHLAQRILDVQESIVRKERQLTEAKRVADLKWERAYQKEERAALARRKARGVALALCRKVQKAIVASGASVGYFGDPLCVKIYPTADEAGYAVSVLVYRGNKQSVRVAKRLKEQFGGRYVLGNYYGDNKDEMYRLVIKA